MGRPSDTREVLIAEALGDFVKVLNRIEAVTPTLENSCSRLEITADRLQGNIEPFEKRIAAMAVETQDRTLKHISQQAALVARNTAAEQTAVMQASARQIFKDEVVPPLERVASQLREANLRRQPSWETWLAHAAVAVCAAGCTFALMEYLTTTGAAETQPAANAPAPGPAAPAPPPSKPRDRR
jgi:hypothetical protein